MKTTWIVGIILSSLVLACASDSSQGAQPPVMPGSKVIFLDQGWTDDERQEFYHTSPGTQLLPYDWFLPLKAKGTERPFKDVMSLFGLIPDQNPSHNPDRLPVGLAKTS